MRVTRHNDHYVVRCTPAEFELLGIAVDQIESGDPRDIISERNLRTSWALRTMDGPFLRVDKDARVNLTEKEIA